MKIRAIILTAILLLSISCNVLQTNLPSSSQPTNTPVPVSSPIPAPGKITGALIEGSEPAQGILIMLGRIGDTACPTELSGWMQIENPPKQVKTDVTGSFTFDEIPPGCYILTAQLSPTAPGVTLRNEAGIGAFTVTAGETTDVGKILITRP